MLLDRILPSVQPQSFLERTRTSFEQSLAKYYAIIVEGNLEAALLALEVGIFSNVQSPKLTRMIQ
jgi:hypothetical protein